MLYGWAEGKMWRAVELYVLHNGKKYVGCYLFPYCNHDLFSGQNISLVCAVVTNKRYSLCYICIICVNRGLLDIVESVLEINMPLSAK